MCASHVSGRAVYNFVLEAAPRENDTVRSRGFTVIEVMMGLAIIGTLAALAVPNYTRFTARAYRTEMRDTLSKMRSYFASQYGEQGVYGADISNAAVNPASPPPAPAAWDSHAYGWEKIPMSLEGGVRMRYWYAISGGGKQLFLQAQGEFPGVGAYVYSETYQDGSLVLITEVPGF